VARRIPACGGMRSADVCQWAVRSLLWHPTTSKYFQAFLSALPAFEAQQRSKSWSATSLQHVKHRWREKAAPGNRLEGKDTRQTHFGAIPLERDRRKTVFEGQT
jgi:hypothetical protein